MLPAAIYSYNGIELKSQTLFVVTVGSSSNKQSILPSEQWSGREDGANSKKRLLTDLPNSAWEDSVHLNYNSSTTELFGTYSYTYECSYKIFERVMQISPILITSIDPREALDDTRCMCA